MSETCVLLLRHGTIEYRRHEGEIELEDIHVYVRDSKEDCFCTVQRWWPTESIGECAILGNDRAAIHYASKRPGYHRLAWVRPWDGTPVFGDLLIVKTAVNDEHEGIFLPFTPSEAAQIARGLQVSGWRLG